MQPIYTPKEAAAVLGMGVRTILGYLREGRIKGFKIGGTGGWRITDADLAIFCETSKEMPQRKYRPKKKKTTEPIIEHKWSGHCDNTTHMLATISANKDFIQLLSTSNDEHARSARESLNFLLQVIQKLSASDKAKDIDSLIQLFSESAKVLENIKAVINNYQKKPQEAMKST